MIAQIIQTIVDLLLVDDAIEYFIERMKKIEMSIEVKAVAMSQLEKRF